jgi:RHS repeat-associated protein
MVDDFKQFQSELGNVEDVVKTLDRIAANYAEGSEEHKAIDVAAKALACAGDSRSTAGLFPVPRFAVPFPVVSRWRNGERTADLAQTPIDHPTSFCVDHQRPCPTSRTRLSYYDSDLAAYYIRAREYEPSPGRFPARDPSAFKDSALYRYAVNNPVRFVDVTGRDWNPIPWSQVYTGRWGPLKGKSCVNATPAEIRACILARPSFPRPSSGVWENCQTDVAETAAGCCLGGFQPLTLKPPILIV